MDWLRYRVPLLAAIAALILCTCLPWARAEFEAADSANLAALNQAVEGYLGALSENVQAMREATELNLPQLSTIKSEIQTLRMAMGEAVPAILTESRLHTTQLRTIADNTDDAAWALNGIEGTLDDIADSLVNQPYRLKQVLAGVEDIGDDLGTSVTLLDGIGEGIDSVDGSIDNLAEGLSGQNAYEDDWGELPEFAPGDIDEEVIPYDDGQTILNRGITPFRIAFRSWLAAISSSVFSTSIWGQEMDGFLSSLPGYLASAPTGISLTSSFSFFGHVVPAMVINWAPLKSSSVLSAFRVFVRALMIGVFGIQSFRRISSAV